MIVESAPPATLPITPDANCSHGTPLPCGRAAPQRTATECRGYNYSVIFHNSNPEEYVEGPGLLRLEDGALLAVVPIVPRWINNWNQLRRVEHSRVHLRRSADGGITWNELARLPRLYTAVPWMHDGRLYLFASRGGTEFRNDDLLLLESRDGGITWSEPVTLFQGHFWNCHTGMVIQDNRLYWAVDDLSFGVHERGPRVIAGDLTGEIMNPAAWRISNAIPFPGVPAELLNPRFSGQPSWYLEPNVLSVRGKIRVLAAVKPQRQSTTGLAAVFDVADDGAELKLKFTQYHPMSGGQLKFCVIWDEVSRLFWMTANLPVDGQGVYDWWPEGGGESGGDDRRFLMLFYGLDGLNWFPAGCIAQAAKVSQSFMYPRPVIDGEDLAIIARSNVAGPSHHDADTATFHWVKDFRKLALNLRPEPESAT